MINFKRFSLTVLFVPILFVGCVSENATSLKPKIETENNVTQEGNRTVSELHTRQEYNNLVSTVVNGKIFLEINEDKLATDIPILIEEQLTTQTLNFDDKLEELNQEDEILETAKNFLGTKYVWAANGPSAFDCSGFTKYVFQQNGINLPRYSAHQANIGKKIKFSELKKGDLVFFDTHKRFKHKVNHVGIFIGKNQFIHASSAKKRVIITSFSKKKFYRNKFLYARRVIGNNDNLAFNLTK